MRICPQFIPATLIDNPDSPEIPIDEFYKCCMNEMMELKKDPNSSVGVRLAKFLSEGTIQLAPKRNRR